MSITAPMPPAQIARNYTHRGWFIACPVYFHRGTSDMVERNGVPSFWFGLNILLLEVAEVLWFTATGKDLCEGFPVRLTGRVDGESA